MRKIKFFFAKLKCFIQRLLSRRTDNLSQYAIQNEGNYGGDYWEKKWWPSLKHVFSNYEVFWQKFIAESLSYRPTDIQIRDTIDPCLEEMAMAHYSAFYHLGISNWLMELDEKIGQQSDERQPSLYSDAVLHLSSATEMVDRFIFSIWKIAVATKNSSDIPPLGNEEEISGKIQDYIKSKGYHPSFKKFKSRGQAVNAPIHTMQEVRDLLSKLMKQPEEWSKIYVRFKSIADQIKQYRNNLVHNPIQGTIELNHETLIPKSTKLFEYAHWSKVFKGKIEDFIPIDQCVKDLLTQLCESSEQIWSHIIGLMESISGSVSYQALLRKAPSEGILARGSNEGKSTMPIVSSSEHVIRKQDTHVISGTNIKSSD